MQQQQPTRIYQPSVVFDQAPVQAICPSCQATVMTRTRRVNGLLTYVLGGIIAAVGCFCGCCLIPCCIPGN